MPSKGGAFPRVLAQEPPPPSRPAGTRSIPIARVGSDFGRTAASAYITRVRSFPWIPRARLGNSPGRTCAARGVGGFSRSLATSRGWLACGNRTGIRGRSGVGVEGLRSSGWGRRRGRVAPRVRDIYESRERDKFVGCATVVRGARIFMAD
jgi:hypothetical protein